MPLPGWIAEPGQVTPDDWQTSAWNHRAKTVSWGR
jgi:hypothetical protein